MTRPLSRTSSSSNSAFDAQNNSWTNLYFCVKFSKQKRNKTTPKLNCQLEIIQIKNVTARTKLWCLVTVEHSYLDI